MVRVLFVCTGNTCRSPMAEAILQYKDHGEFIVKSAGIFAMAGMEASEGTKQVLKEWGIEKEHRSQPVTEDLVEWADLVLTMTKGHAETLKNDFPEASAKTFPLKSYVSAEDEGDILDPIGGTVETYRETADELDKLLDALREKVKRNG